MKRTALIVDDKPQNLGVLVDVLSRAGFRVLVAEDGAAAIEQAPRAAPDVILLDIMMPGLDGYETARRLRTLRTTAEVPILFVTALDQTVDRVRALAAGGVDFITKPFRADEVLARVATHAELCALRRRHTRLRDKLAPLADVSAGVRAAIADDDELA